MTVGRSGSLLLAHTDLTLTSRAKLFQALTRKWLPAAERREEEKDGKNNHRKQLSSLMLF